MNNSEVVKMMEVGQCCRTINKTQRYLREMRCKTRASLL